MLFLWKIDNVIRKGICHRRFNVPSYGMTRTEGSNVRPYDGTLELLRVASSESVLSILYTSLRFVLFFYVHKLFTKVSIIFFAKMLTNNMVGAILIYERC